MRAAGLALAVTYRFSRKADEDLENLYVFGVERFGVAQSERYYAGLIAALSFLSDHPLAAPTRPELGPGTRAHPYKSHIIFYRLDSQDIFVQRIRHGREDWKSQDPQP